MYGLPSGTTLAGYCDDLLSVPNVPLGNTRIGLGENRHPSGNCGVDGFCESNDLDPDVLHEQVLSLA
jgi:hypothetical protein